MLKFHRLVPESLSYYFGRERGQEPGYYTDHHEPTPRWLRTAGLEGLEVGGEIDVEMAYRIFEGRHPVTGEPLRDHEVGEIKDVTVMEDVLDEHGRPVLGPDGKPLRQPVLDEDGNPVVQKRTQVVGMDLTFSAVKSVSVLWGLASDEQKAIIEAAHREAIDVALSYLEKEAAMVRRGKGGHDFLRADVVAIETPHRASREKDPHLHTHVLLAALGLGADGRWSSLDTRALYAFSKTAGMFYQAALREALTRDLKVAWEIPNEHGLAEIAGVPQDLIQHFSKRRHQIVGAVLDHSGDISDPCHTNAAQKATRRSKQSVTDEEYRGLWELEALKLGWDLELIWERIEEARYLQMLQRETANHEERFVQFSRRWRTQREVLNTIASVLPWTGSQDEKAGEILNGVARSAFDDPSALRTVLEQTLLAHGYLTEDLDRVANAVLAYREQAAAVLSQVTYLSTTFRRQDLERALLVAGCPLKELDAAVENVLAFDDCIRIGGEDAGRQVGRDAMGIRTGSQDREVFTSREVLEAERELLNAAIEGQGEQVGVVPDHILEPVLWRKNEDSVRAGFGGVAAEQKELVRCLTSGDRLNIVQAGAGSGKTYALGIAAAAWHRANVPVIGCVVSQQATNVLAEETGIECRNIAKLISELQRGERELEEGTVLVVDEAGMVGTRALKFLHDQVAAVNGKIVLVGDRRQIGAIEAGGLFRAIQEQVPEVVVQMHANRRQRQQWELEALKVMWARDDSAIRRDHDKDKRNWVEEVIDSYKKRDRVVVGDGAAATQMKMVQDYFEAKSHSGSEGGVIMIAARNSDVQKLDALARAEAWRRGELGEAFTFADREYRVGERVLTTKTDQKLGLTNGTLGSVVGVEDRPVEWSVTVEPLERDEETGEFGRRADYVSTIYWREDTEPGKVITSKNGTQGFVQKVHREVKSWSVTIDAPGGVRTITRKEPCEVGEIIGTRGGGRAEVLAVEPARTSYEVEVRWFAKDREWKHRGSMPPEIGKVIKRKGEYFRVVAAEPKVLSPHLIVDSDRTTTNEAGAKIREQVAIPASYIRDGHVKGGYATTVNKSQGVTCEAGLTYLAGMNAYKTYVAASRGRGHESDEKHILNNRFYVPVEVSVSDAESEQLQKLSEELRETIEDTKAYKEREVRAYIRAGILRAEGDHFAEPELPDHFDPTLEFTDEEAKAIQTKKEEIATLRLKEALTKVEDELTSYEQVVARKMKDASLEEKRIVESTLARVMLTAPKSAEEIRAEVEKRLEQERAEVARLHERGASVHVLKQRSEVIRALERKIYELTPREGYTPPADMKRQQWVLEHEKEIQAWRKVSRDIKVTEEQLVALASYEQPPYLPPMPKGPLEAQASVEGKYRRQLHQLLEEYQAKRLAIVGTPETIDIGGLEETVQKKFWVLTKKYREDKAALEKELEQALEPYANREAWRKAVVAISTYRDRWQVEDETIALPVVDEASQNELWRRDYEEALRKLAELANEGLDVGAANLLQLAEAGLVNVDEDQLRQLTEDLAPEVRELAKSSVRNLGVRGHALDRAA